MKTFTPDLILARHLLFISYLWGMKTYVNMKTRLLLWQFISYLWGMKTQKSSLVDLKCFSLYPTFEEWKQTFYHAWCLSDRYKFISYLWGMKTDDQIQIFLYHQRLYPTFKEWFGAWLIANSAGEKWRVRSD